MQCPESATVPALGKFLVLVDDAKSNNVIKTTSRAPTGSSRSRAWKGNNASACLKQYLQIVKELS
jgi:hypothetical protein